MREGVIIDVIGDHLQSTRDTKDTGPGLTFTSLLRTVVVARVIKVSNPAEHFNVLYAGLEIRRPALGVGLSHSCPSFRRREMMDLLCKAIASDLGIRKPTDEDRSNAFRDGTLGFFFKPSTKEETEEVIRKHVGDNEIEWFEEFGEEPMFNVYLDCNGNGGGHLLCVLPNVGRAFSANF